MFSYSDRKATMTAQVTRPDVVGIALRARDHHEAVKELSIDGNFVAFYPLFAVNAGSRPGTIDETT